MIKIELLQLFVYDDIGVYQQLVDDTCIMHEFSYKSIWKRGIFNQELVQHNTCLVLGKEGYMFWVYYLQVDVIL